MTEEYYTTLRDNDHFNVRVREYEELTGGKVYTADLTLFEIWDWIERPRHKVGITHEEWVDHFLRTSTIIAHMDSVKNIIKTDDPLINKTEIDLDDIGSAYCIPKVYKDIQNSTSVNPISVTVFENGSASIHPGGSRLSLVGKIHRTFPVVITDFSGKVPDKISVRDVETINFSFIGQSLLYIIRPLYHSSRKSLHAWGLDNGMSFKNMTSDKKYAHILELLGDNKFRLIHEIADGNNKWKYTEELGVRVPMQFEYISSPAGDVLTADGCPIFKQLNGLWEFV